MRASYFLVAVLMTGCGGDEFTSASVFDDAGSHDALATDAPHDVTASDGAKADAGAEAGQKADAGKDAQAPEAGLDATAVDAVAIDATPLCASVMDREFSSVADGAIFPGACNGANSYTNGLHANVGAGRGLLRFQMDQELAAAFAMPGKVLGISLVLQRNTNCEGDLNACVGTLVPGQILAYPLVSDWVEGNGTAYSGADWCRKGAGGQGAAQWQVQGADGPNDHGGQAGSAKVDAVQDSVTISLDPASFQGWINDSGSLSILLVPNLATFVFATRESDMYSPPRLIIKYCE